MSGFFFFGVAEGCGERGNQRPYRCLTSLYHITEQSRLPLAGASSVSERARASRAAALVNIACQSALMQAPSFRRRCLHDDFGAAINTSSLNGVRIYILTDQLLNKSKVSTEAQPGGDTAPQNEHRLGTFGMLMSAAGVALMTVTMLGSAAFAVIWSFGKLLGVPDWFVLPFYAAAVGLVLWVAVWVTGRAWHVERLLESGKDIDVPVFKALHYWTKRLIAASVPSGVLAYGGEWLDAILVIS